MSGAGDAGVVVPDCHLAGPGDVVVRLMGDLWDQFPEVLLDAGQVLGGGSNNPGLLHETAVIDPETVI